MSMWLMSKTFIERLDKHRQLSLYHMSMWLMSKTFIERLDKHGRKFFWHGCNKKNRYYLVKWKRV